MIEQEDYDKLWDEHLAAREEIAELRECLLGAYECMSSLNNFVLLALNHPEAKEHGIWRKAIFQYLARLQKNLAKGIETPETTSDED